MKKIIIIAVCAILHGTTALSQTADNATVYIINGEKITNFDGSQLKGKTVTEYRIGTAEKDGKQTTVHFIDVSDGTNADSPYTKGKVIHISESAYKMAEMDADFNKVKEGSDNSGLKDALIYVDGKEYDGKLSDLNGKDIKSVNIYKAGSDLAKSHGEKGKNGLIMITTKAKLANTVYLIDGKRVEEDAAKKISPKDIKAITVLKHGSKEAIELGGEEGKTLDYIMIELK